MATPRDGSVKKEESETEWQSRSWRDNTGGRGTGHSGGISTKVLESARTQPKTISGDDGKPQIPG